MFRFRCHPATYFLRPILMILDTVLLGLLFNGYSFQWWRILFIIIVIFMVLWNLASALPMFRSPDRNRGCRINVGCLTCIFFGPTEKEPWWAQSVIDAFFSSAMLALSIIFLVYWAVWYDSHRVAVTVVAFSLM